MGLNIKSAWNALWNNPVVNTPLSLQDPRLASSIKFFYANGVLQWESVNNPTALKNIYKNCPPVASLIDNMADAFVNGEIQALNSRTENKVRGVNKEWQTLIDNPNWFQDQSQFFKQLYTYRKLFGWCYVLKVRSVGFDKPTSLIVLPNWLLEIDYQMGLGWQDKDARKVYLCLDGRRELIDNDDLMLFTDVSNIFDETVWLPMPRIYTAQYSLTLIISILEASTTLVQNKGAIGIISNGNEKIDGTPIPMMPKQKEDLQNQWQNNYGLSRDKAQMIFTNANIQYTPLVFDETQLQLQQKYLSALKDLSDKLNYPFELSAHSDRSTYNNIKEAKKDLYQNAIIPDAKSIFKAFDKQLLPPEVTLWCDYGHVDVLQSNKKEQAEARYKANQALKIEWDNNIITRNQWLMALEQEIVARPEFDKYKYELTPEEMGIIMQDNGNNDSTQIPQQQ